MLSQVNLNELWPRGKEGTGGGFIKETGASPVCQMKFCLEILDTSQAATESVKT